MKLTLCKNDKDWSRRVMEKNGGRCYQCTRLGTPAHLFRRTHKETRLILEAGIPLCIIHHHIYDNATLKEQRKMAIIFIGKIMYEKLFRLIGGSYYA